VRQQEEEAVCSDPVTVCMYIYIDSFIDITICTCVYIYIFLLYPHPPLPCIPGAAAGGGGQRVNPTQPVGTGDTQITDLTRRSCPSPAVSSYPPSCIPGAAAGGGGPDPYIYISLYIFIYITIYI